MSKNLNEEQLNSRLSNIFSDLDKPKEFPGLDSTSDLSGWIWEIDTRGVLTGCSPEIEYFLGIPAHQIIGNPLNTYSDFDLESAGLPSNSNRALMPTQIEINFTAGDGTSVPTDSFILGKLDDEGSILSWRGITSVIHQEIVEPEEESEEADQDPFKALATLDITPEIPQPDLSLSDIWKDSTKDTAPLSMEEVLEEGQAFQSSLEQAADSSQSGTGELKTFQVNRVPEVEEVEEEEVEEAEEETVEEAEEVSIDQFEFTEEPFSQTPQQSEAMEMLSSFEPFEPQGEMESLASEESIPTESIEEVEIQDEVETVEEQEEAPEQPVMIFGSSASDEPFIEEEETEAEEEIDQLSAVQDEIETIRYERDAFLSMIQAAEDTQPEAEEAAPEEVELEAEIETSPAVDLQDAVEGTTSEWVADEPIHEELVIDELVEETILEEAGTPETETAPGIQEQVDQISSDWVPEFKSLTPTHEIDTARLETEEPVLEPQPENTGLSTKELSTAQLGDEEPPTIIEEETWPTITTADEEEIQPDEDYLTEPAEIEFYAEETIELEDEGLEEQPSPEIMTAQSGVPVFNDPESLEFVEKTQDIDTASLTPLDDTADSRDEIAATDFEQFPTYEVVDSEPEAIEEPELDHTPASTKELDVQEVAARAAEVHLESPAAADVPEPVERINSLNAFPDLDLEKELIEPEGPPDTDSLDPFPDNASRPIRRPTIDTASLIPSLLRQKGQTGSQLSEKPADEFLDEVEKDTIKVQTKELESYTSGDGTELTISRGVQELLKIVDDNPNRVWKEDELRLVEQVHTQLELALENANLFQQTQLALAETDERARQLRLLNQMSEQINQTDDLFEIFKIVAIKARDIFRVDRASVSVVTEDRRDLEVSAVAGAPGELGIGQRIPIENTPNQIVIRENRVFILPNAKETGEIKSGMTGPITTSNTVIGTLNLSSQQSNLFNDRDANLLTQLLSITNASVENRRLFEQIESALAATEEQARRLAELNRLGENFSRATSIDEVFHLIAGNLNKIVNTDFWGYATIFEENQTYKLHLASDQFSTPPTPDEERILEIQPLEETIIGKAARERRTITEFNCKDSQFRDVRQSSEQNSVRTAMATPIIAGNKTIGVITIGSKQLSAYTVQEENILLSVASLSGSTIDNRQLLTQIQKRSQQLETSAEVSQVASTMLDPTELLPKVVELIKDGFNLYYAGIFLVDETGVLTGDPGRWAVLRAGSGEPGSQMIASGHRLEVGGESMIGTAISSSQARIALNVGDEAQFFRNPYLPNTQSEMALPLVSRGQVLGAISIQSELENAFSSEDITALQTMADQLANAIENARLFEQTEIRAEELTVLNEMARGFSQSMEIEDLIRNTYEFTGRLMDATNFYMVLYYPEEQFYEFRLFVESGELLPPPQRRVRLGEGLTDWIIRNKLPVLIPADVGTYLQALGIDARDRLPKSWLGVPMLLGNEVTGVIAVQNYVNENVYNNHSLDLLIAVSSQAAVAIDNARRFQATQTRARHEEILRRVTTQVHSTSDPDMILRTAVREVSDALGKPAFVKLATDQAADKQSLPSPQPPLEPPENPAAPPTAYPDHNEAEER